MTRAQINLDAEQIQSLLSGDSAGMRLLVQQAVNQFLQAELSEHLQAESGERTDDRRGYRNGTYPRRMTTRVGTIELDVPRDRDGTFRTELFERFQRSERALVLALMDMVVHGVATRKVAHITETLCGHSFSKSTVSRLSAELDTVVDAWRNRPLSRQSYPFVIADAMYIKVRREGRVRSTAVLIAVGIGEDGYREVLGVETSIRESNESWSGFFGRLRQRGLAGIDYTVSDAHEGLVAALREYFPGSTWQRCQVHFMRNVLDVTPKKHRDRMVSLLRQILHADDPDEARKALERAQSEMQHSAEKALGVLETGFDDAIAVLALPNKYRRRLRTSNMLERLNEEIRRREKPIRIFANDESAIRLIGALLMEHHEAWVASRQYLNLDDYRHWKVEQEKCAANNSTTSLKSTHAA